MWPQKHKSHIVQISSRKKKNSKETLEKERTQTWKTKVTSIHFRGWGHVYSKQWNRSLPPSDSGNGALSSGQKIAFLFVNLCNESLSSARFWNTLYRGNLWIWMVYVKLRYETTIQKIWNDWSSSLNPFSCTLLGSNELIEKDLFWRTRMFISMRTV